MATGTAEGPRARRSRTSCEVVWRRAVLLRSRLDLVWKRETPIAPAVVLSLCIGSDVWESAEGARVSAALHAERIIFVCVCVCVCMLL